MSLRERVPLIGFLRGYASANFRRDLIAGVTVSALVVPKALGYAEIAMVPVERGLYAAAAGALLYAVFGTSRQISTGPSSALAAVAASAVVVSGVAAGDETVQLVAAITIATGLLFVVTAMLRMGWLSRLLSRAVITGFLFGAAIDVVVGELPKLTGTTADGDNSWRQLADWLAGIDAVHATTLVLGLGGLALVVVLRRVAPRIPGALVLVVGGLLVSRLFDLAGRGVATVGEVPRGLPSPELPSVDLMADHAATIAIAAVGLFLIGFSQSAGDARVFAARHRYRIRMDQEMVAQGMSNVGAGVFQGMPVSTSLSASSLNDAAGARTPVASLVTSVAVVMTLLVLAPLFSDLPKPVLAAIIIDAVVFGMMDIAEMRRLRRVKRVDFWIAVLAAVGVLSAGVLAGVVIGVILSVCWLVYAASTPAVTELGRERGTSAFWPVDDRPDLEQAPGMLIVRFDGGLTFVSADGLRDEIIARLADDTTPVAAVIVDCAGINFVDSQGVGELGELVRLAARDGWSLRLVRVRPAVRSALDADGVLDHLGADRLHGNVDEAVKAELALRS